MFQMSTCLTRLTLCSRKYNGDVRTAYRNTDAFIICHICDLIFLTKSPLIFLYNYTYLRYLFSVYVDVRQNIFSAHPVYTRLYFTTNSLMKHFLQEELHFLQ